MNISHNTKGFTLVELLVAATIFVISMTVIATTGVNLYQNYKRQLARDNLYEETRTLLDRIAQEVRENTVDYDEYFNHLGEDLGGGVSVGTYGDYYRAYYHHFFYVTPPTTSSSPCAELGLNDPARYAYEESDPCRAQHVNEGFFATGADNDADGANAAANSALAGNNFHSELYLMDSTGKKKTIIKRLPGEDGPTQAGILQLELKDQYNNATITPGPAQGSPDGYYDCWANHPDFPSRHFISISPANIEVTDLKFFISPIDDPRKAFNESDVKVQVQPNVTIVLTARVAANEARKFHGETTNPTITLETTVSSRIYENVLIPFALDGANATGVCDRSLSPPSGGSDSVSPPSDPVCGNGVRESGEECDTNDFGGQTCSSISGSYTGGTLSCRMNGGPNACTLNTNSCTSSCTPSPGDPKKCQICHVSENSCNTQNIDEKAWEAHVLKGGHGDFNGPCTPNCLP